MFKYIKYTPITDAYTTHIFNSINDDCKVHRFNVPCVSVEYSKEDDFTELMNAQKAEIGSIEITKAEFEELVKYSKQVTRIYDIANALLEAEMSIISNKYTKEERDTWNSQLQEAEAVKAGSLSKTFYVDKLAKDEGTSLKDAADKILGKKLEFDMHASECIERKWGVITKLKGEVGL